MDQTKQCGQLTPFCVGHVVEGIVILKQQWGQ